MQGLLQLQAVCTSVCTFYTVWKVRDYSITSDDRRLMAADHDRDTGLPAGAGDACQEHEGDRLLTAADHHRGRDLPARAGDAGQEHEGGAVGTGWLCTVSCQAWEIGPAVPHAGIGCTLLKYALPPGPLLLQHLLANAWVRPNSGAI